MRVLVVLLHARFSIVGPIPFLLAAIFFPGHPYLKWLAEVCKFIGKFPHLIHHAQESPKLRHSLHLGDCCHLIQKAVSVENVLA